MAGLGAGEHPGMGPLSHARVGGVPRRVDRLATPGVRRLRRPPDLPTAQRDAWWAERVAMVAAAGAAAPRFAGQLGDPLPLQNTLPPARQSLAVLPVAGEHGLTDPAERVSLLAGVLLDRDMPPEKIRPLMT